jgi:IS30 family transposase
METYRQIRVEEREKIAGLLESKSTITEIAKALGRSKSTISREIKRNRSSQGNYWPDTADRKARSRCYRESLLDRNERLRELVKDKLCCHFWTPEQIAGYLKYRQTDLPSVSHETIYTWIYKKPQKEEKLWKFLPRHKATRGLRKSKGAGVNRIPNRVSIHDRPQTVLNEFGHWEGDLMAFLKNSQHILVLRERKSMFTKSIPLETKKASTTAQKVIDLMKKIPLFARRSLTLDNGGEFAGHEIWLQYLNLPSFFCDPYASWQKGGVENTNGRLRRDLPRNTNIRSMSGLTHLNIE